MSAEDELLSVPTEALAIYEPVAIEEDNEAEAVDEKSLDDTREERWPQFENIFRARLALVEAEGELETAWDLFSCAQREWSTLDEKLLDLQDEHDESCEAIELLERRIIKLLQDRDLAIAETYTTEKQIQDAEFFKMRQQQRRQQEEEEQKKARVASALRKLLLRRGSTENDDATASPASSPDHKFSDKDVHRLQKELADSKVAAALAKAELDERRNALRRAERQFTDVKLTLAQAQTEEDDLQVSLQQLARARRSSTESRAMEAKPVYFQEPDEDESEEEQNPGAFMWIEGDSLAPPCQSERDVVSKIVEIARVTPDDVVVDLGCGDGRICIEAAKRFGARARGVEIEEFLIKRFRELIVANDLQQLVTVSHGDLLEEDLSDATVIVTYLLPDALDELMPKFTKLLGQEGKNVRIICNTWGIRGLTPSERHDAGPYGNVPLFVYRSNCSQSPSRLA
ncbi:hypothetical protein BBP00_00006139 [Phytophthora kernoviae]|uniref:Methyltransferase domain-containing protein n=1 Tax=Phytophthora kernoviae TaxID=325452 RepID=A0A3F2RMK4_9STRA|nr:hypothetical protein BBP00_00006139 [Phytophthora kernoviae]